MTPLSSMQAAGLFALSSGSALMTTRNLGLGREESRLLGKTQTSEPTGGTHRLTSFRRTCLEGWAFHTQFRWGPNLDYFLCNILLHWFSCLRIPSLFLLSGMNLQINYLHTNSCFRCGFGRNLNMGWCYLTTFSCKNSMKTYLGMQRLVFSCIFRWLTFSPLHLQWNQSCFHVNRLHSGEGRGKGKER